MPKVDLTLLPEYYQRRDITLQTEEDVEDWLAIIEFLEEKYGKD